MSQDAYLNLLLEIGRLQGQIAACQAASHRTMAEVDAIRARTTELLTQAATLALSSQIPGRN